MNISNFCQNNMVKVNVSSTVNLEIWSPGCEMLIQFTIQVNFI